MCPKRAAAKQAKLSIYPSWKIRVQLISNLLEESCFIATARRSIALGAVCVGKSYILGSNCSQPLISKIAQDWRQGDDPEALENSCLRRWVSLASSSAKFVDLVRKAEIREGPGDHHL
jgi:hypothetical protein